MSDIVVTVAKTFTLPSAPGLKGLAAWIKGVLSTVEPLSFDYFCEHTIGCARPQIAAAERVYILCEGRIRGFCPLIGIREVPHAGKNTFRLLLGAGGEAVTVPWDVNGFGGWCYRWWDRSDELPFPDWRTVALAAPFTAKGIA